MLGAMFAHIFKKFAHIFKEFVKVFRAFARILHDFKEFCPDFHQIKTFEGALASLHPRLLHQCLSQ